MQPYGPPPARPGPPRWLLFGGIGCGGLLAVFVLLVIIGLIIGPPPEGEAAPSPTPSAPRPTSAPPAPREVAPTPAPSSTAPRAVPSPDAAEQAAYLAAIARIDPGLTVNTERVMRRAGRICERIVRPPGGNLSLEQYVVLELSGGNATINESQAREVVKAIRVWCR